MVRQNRYFRLNISDLVELFCGFYNDFGALLIMESSGRGFSLVIPHFGVNYPLSMPILIVNFKLVSEGFNFIFESQGRKNFFMEILLFIMVVIILFVKYVMGVKKVIVIFIFPRGLVQTVKHS